MGRFIFSRLVVEDASASKKYKNGVASLLERVHLVLLLILVWLIAPGQANAQFAQQGSKLVGNDVVGNTVFQGVSVSLSSDGNTALVGGFDEHAGEGAAWVYIRSGGVWTQQGTKLVGTGAVGIAQQGISVSLSSDGNTAIVGGHNDNSALGAAWVFIRSGGVWTQQGSKLVGTGAVGSAEQGFSVSLSPDGNTAIVGGYTDNSNAGAAWVFTRSGGAWTQQGNKLVGADAVGTTAQQGRSVSLSSDGNTAIVGGEGDNTFAGAAWVWTRSDGIWTQQGSKLVGTGAVDAARQGYSVSISSDGNTAIVGGYFDNATAGAAWVWKRSDGIWAQQGSKLVGTGAVGGISRQGFSVSLSSDGNVAIVGAYHDNSNAGAAWIWTRSGGVWTQQGNKLFGTGAVGSAQQGYSVSLSGDGNTAIVGGLVDNSNKGAAWIYTTPNPASVDLLTAGTYGALSFGGITGSANVSGDVGSSNSTVGVNIHPTGTNWTNVNNAHNLQAQTDLGLALSDALSRTANGTIAADALGGVVLHRGVYEGGALDLAGGATLELNGSATDVFIIKASSSLTINSGSTVSLTGGAVWSNVFWYVGSSAIIFDGTTFNGTILAVISITLNASATQVTSRLLANTGAVGISSNVLPVELVAFTATANRTNADLHWSTATEVNNYGFEIERKPLGFAVSPFTKWDQGGFQKVGFVAGAGTSNSPRDYSYTDKNLSPGHYAYRIKQIDNSGSFAYHGSVEVEIGSVPQAFALLQNYPNPFNPSTTIRYGLPSQSKVRLIITNTLGQEVVVLTNGEKEAGYHEVEWQANVASGLYFYRIDAASTSDPNNRFIQVKKMLLLK